MRIKLPSGIVFTTCLLAAILQCATAYGDVLNNWAVKTLAPTSPPVYPTPYFEVKSMTRGLERYVAVGQFMLSDYGGIAYSFDGLTWNNVPPGDSVTNGVYNLYSVAYGNGTFVAVGYWGSLYTSTNGIDWARQFLPVINLYSVAYGNGLFAAVGDRALHAGGMSRSNIFTSVDGVDWIARPYSSAPTDIYSVAYGDGKFLAVGASNSFYSSNGENWFRAGGPGFIGYYSQIFFANGAFIVPGQFGTNWVAPANPNTIPPSLFPAWHTVAHDNSLRVDSIAYRDGVYIGSGFSSTLGTNVMITSINGTNWVQESYRHPYTIRKIVPDGPRVLAVGSSGTTSVALAGDFFKMTAMKATNATPRLRVAASVGRVCEIEYADLQPTGWQPLTNFGVTNSPVVFVDATWTNSPSRFYRGRVQP